MLPAAKLGRPELELALALYEAAYGRPFRDRTMRAVFEERPWGPCNPAFLVAHGQALGAPSVEAFLASHPCPADCVKERARPRDPYGERWSDPLCWYSPASSMAMAMITDPAVRKQADAIEVRLARLEKKAAKAKAARSRVPPAEAPGGGCGCSLIGEGSSGWPALVFLAAGVACALGRRGWRRP
jgi:hypothetical protein